MPSRRQSKWNRPARPLGAGGAGGSERVEAWHGREYRVRSVASTSGPYRCPGCDQLLASGVAHVVAWPDDDPDATDRRHWHTACWAARATRVPGVQRSRNAPRYG